MNPSGQPRGSHRHYLFRRKPQPVEYQLLAAGDLRDPPLLVANSQKGIRDSQHQARYVGPLHLHGTGPDDQPSSPVIQCAHRDIGAYVGQVASPVIQCEQEPSW